MNTYNFNKNLYTDQGNTIPELNLPPKSYIDKTITIYGPTKTGKTVIIKNIMKMVNTYIDQILVISPSEPSNRSYEGFVDPPFIHYKLYNTEDSSSSKKDNWKDKASTFLESIWKRQEMMAAIYTRSNRIDILADLFNYIDMDIQEDATFVIKNILDKKKEAIGQIEKKYEEGIRDEKIKSITATFDDMLIQVYKKYILIDYKHIWICNLTEDERYTLQYISFNPRLLLIFDDCSAQLKPFFTKEIFRKLFYQNRHSYITLIISCQDDTDLPTNLRKNSFINFYTEPVVCLSNFERSSNKYTKQAKAFITDILPVVFKGYRKLAYIREDEKSNYFYHITFEYPKVFKFGSQALHELCKIIQNNGTTMDISNPYYNHFKL
jgi:hypothetical protein